MNFFLCKDQIKQWSIDQAIHHSRRTIIISILATLILGSGLRFLVMDDDMMKMLPKDLESKISWDAVQDEFGSTEIIFVAFGHEESSVYGQKALSDLWVLSENLRMLDVVHKITNISTATRIDQYDGFMEIDDLQSSKKLTENEIDEIKKYLDKNSELKKQLVSRDENYLLTIIQPNDDVGLDRFRNSVVHVSDSILVDYKIHYGGTAYVTGSVPQLIRKDVQSLIKVGLVIMLMMLLVNLRSFQAVLMVMAVIVSSLIAMMGFMGWAYKITGSDRFLFALLNTSMPIILLTIANSDGVHVITKFFREFRRLGNVQSAIEASMGALLVPIFLTSITTIAAFLTMITSPLEPLIGYGICISVGIAWAWILSSILLPAIINMREWDQNSNFIANPSVLERLVSGIGRMVVGYPKHVFSGGLALVILGLFGLNRVSVDVNVANFFKPGTEIRDSMDFMDQEMSGTMDLRIRIEGDVKDPTILNQMDSLQTFIEDNDQVIVTYSIADVVKQMHRTVMDDSMKYESIPLEREKVNNLFTMYYMSGDAEELASVVDHDHEVALITSLSSVMSTEDVFLFVGSITEYIKGHFQGIIDISVTGMIVVIRDMVLMVISSSLLSILISIVLIGLITSVFFGRVVWGGLSVIPLIGAVILNFGLMGHFNITLNHITAILSSIIIGVGVDFAIHFIAQFRRLSETVKEKNLTKEVVGDVGYPILLDAASNMGFGALIFSAFIPVQYIGGLMVFAMLSTSLGTLTLLASSTELLTDHLIKKGR
ncbi:MAG: MMPL family transporter [Candidatus Marinimicrobia bacterium]|nr:MMPL family transporter [Candidatus Neomarinimicrobiota bacterium]